jgi:hypothetical protein
MNYKVNENIKAELEEFAEELIMLGETLKDIASGGYGAKTKAVEWRKKITEVKREITEYKRKTNNLFKGGE